MSIEAGGRPQAPDDSPAGAGATPAGVTPGPQARVTVRYFAGAAAATGIDEEQLAVLPGLPLEDLIDELARRHGPALATILEASSFLIDEVTGPRERRVPAGSTVDVLPPFAGG